MPSQLPAPHLGVFPGPHGLSTRGAKPRGEHAPELVVHNLNGVAA